MTVPEPTPDNAPRASLLLRRVGFAAMAAALIAAFALTLSGIATTRGAVRPNGQAAANAAAQQRTSDVATGRHHCRRGDRTRGGATSGRV
jgi:hypothetical protein